MDARTGLPRKAEMIQLGMTVGAAFGAVLGLGAAPDTIGSLLIGLAGFGALGAGIGRLAG